MLLQILWKLPIHFFLKILGFRAVLGLQENAMGGTKISHVPPRPHADTASSIINITHQNAAFLMKEWTSVGAS